MDELKLPEVLERLKEEGFDITKRTFEYYQRIELLPSPQKKVGKRGRGVYGYYIYQEVLLAMQLIYELKKEGFTLVDIKQTGEDRLIEQYESVLNEWGFPDYKVSKMEDSNPMAKDGTISEIKKRMFGAKAIEREVVENLRWWYSDKVIELYALKYIQDKTLGLLSGLNIAIDEINQKMESYRNSDFPSITEIWTLIEIYRKLEAKYEKLMGLQFRTYARMAEISGKEYGGLTKEKWEEQEKKYLEITKAHYKRLDDIKRLANEKENDKRTSNDRKKD